MIIIARIIQIQFIQGSKYREKAKAISLKDITIEPNRGDILAADGRLLASSIPFYEIRMDMQAKGLDRDEFMNNIDSLSMCLANLFTDKPVSMYKQELIKAYNEGRRFYLIKRRVNFIQLKELKTFPLFRSAKNKSGMVAFQENIRYQPHQNLASRTIGYISKSEAGNTVGIEGSFDQYLRGVKGIRLMQRLSGGVWMPVNDNNEVDPKDGYDVVSTIDVNIQDVAESALRKRLEANNAHHGCVVVMEVQTGEIKAITNMEKDDNGRYRELYNYAIGECAEPGSTFKLVSMIVALEDGFVQPEDTIDTGNGTYVLFDKKIKDSDEKGHGRISLKQVFEVSSNIGVAKTINRLYSKKERHFIDRIYEMKLNQKLNLDISGEGTPYIKYPGDKLWSGISLAMMSIGYEIRLAPIHMLTFYNAIANNGKMVKPRFVHEVSYHGKTIKRFGTEVINSSVCSGSTLEKVKSMLEGVVEHGTAISLRNNYYKIAGKTGTAQIAHQASGYRSVQGISYQASFVGYFPADNPKYTCIVVINSPSNQEYYASQVAGPVFKEIADKLYATSLSIQPTINPGKVMVDIPYSKTGFKKDLDYIFDELNISLKDNNIHSNWVSTSKTDKQVIYTDRAIMKNLVPNVVDMGLRDALFLLENAGLKVMVKGCGKVVSQSISAGALVHAGDTIILEMSIG
jgi:cell division protein FtsI (penicillin-binding protein 3)